MMCDQVLLTEFLLLLKDFWYLTITTVVSSVHNDTAIPSMFPKRLFQDIFHSPNVGH